MAQIEAEIAALYDGIVAEAGLDDVLRALAERHGCASASIVSFDPVTPAASLEFACGSFDARVRRLYNEQFATLDPAPATFAARPSGTGFASNRLFSRKYLRQSVFLNEFLRPLGIEETLGGTISAADGRLAFFTIHRGAARQAFADNDVDEIERLLPHLERALQLRRAFARLKTKAALFANAIDRLPMGVVVIGHEAGVSHANRAACAIAARGDGLRLDREGIPHAHDRADERALAGQRNAVAAGLAGGIVRVRRNGGARPYAVLVAPMPADVGANLGVNSPNGTLVLIHDPDAATANVADAVAAIFGMPHGAAQLVAALIAGEDARAYAARNGITYDTARYHLKTAFGRTGVRSQAQLLQLVARALAEFDKHK